MFLILEKPLFSTDSCITYSLKFCDNTSWFNVLYSLPQGLGSGRVLGSYVLHYGSFKKIHSHLTHLLPSFLILDKQVSHSWMLSDWLLIFWMLEHFVQTSMDIWWLLIYPGRITNRLNRLNKIWCRIF